MNLRKKIGVTTMMNASIDNQMLNKHAGFYTEIERPTWTEHFMNQAIEISKRSPDGQTKHGCVITDMFNHQLATGYNAPAKNLPDRMVPNLRPNKYALFLHSEINAIINAMVPLWSVPNGIRVYVTGIPCVYCLSALVNCNIKELYYFDDYGWSKDKDGTSEFDFIVYHSDIKLFPQDKKNYSPTELK